MNSNWWKIPQSFGYLIMNTGELQEVSRENISSEMLDSIIGLGDKLYEDDVALPALPPHSEYWINLSQDAGAASFTISIPTETTNSCGGIPLSYGFFSLSWDEDDSAWGCAEANYYKLTDKSGLSEWSVPQKPESKPWLAIVRFDGDLRCPCEYCRRKEPEITLEHLPSWLSEVEKAIGWRLTQELTEAYEDYAEDDDG